MAKKEKTIGKLVNRLFEDDVIMANLNIRLLKLVDYISYSQYDKNTLEITFKDKNNNKKFPIHKIIIYNSLGSDYGVKTIDVDYKKMSSLNNKIIESYLNDDNLIGTNSVIDTVKHLFYLNQI